MTFEMTFLLFPIALVALLVAASASMPKPPPERSTRYKRPWEPVTQSSDMPQPALIAAAEPVESSHVTAAGMQ